ncbi:MAG: hypothetical protein KGK12_11450, partial [Armatimonadetes bacterium]|nr:hypothetical protein [Armatimonadota bacterium]
GRGNQSAAEYDLEGYVTRQMDFYSRSGRTDHTFPHYHEMVWAPNARNDRGGSPKEILGKESPEP